MNLLVLAVPLAAFLSAALLPKGRPTLAGLAFAVLIGGVLSLAGAVEWSRARDAGLADAASATAAARTAATASGGGSEPVEVRWTSLIPGTFK